MMDDLKEAYSLGGWGISDRKRVGVMGVRVDVMDLKGPILKGLGDGCTLGGHRVVHYKALVLLDHPSYCHFICIHTIYIIYMVHYKALVLLYHASHHQSHPTPYIHHNTLITTILFPLDPCRIPLQPHPQLQPHP